MYAHHLATPHTLKLSPEQQPRMLMEEIAGQEVVQLLSRAPERAQDAHQDVRVESAKMISDAVGRSLWFPEEKHDRNDFERYGVERPISLDEISRNQMANCFGYTFVTSEILDEYDLDHLVSYGNGHMFILLPPTNVEDISQSYLLDPLSPNVNQFLHRSVLRGTRSSVENGITTTGRGLLMLDSRELATQITADFDELSAQHPWLLFSDSYKERNGYFQADEQAYSRYITKSRIIVSLFPSSTGRHMIKDYVQLQRALAYDDVSSACASLRSMSGSYPEIDARQKHSEVQTIVSHLCKQGETDQAKEMVDVYFENFSVSSDSRIPEAKADMLRKIASISGEIALAEEAELLYKKAVTRKGAFRQRLLGKCAAAQTLQKSLAPTD
ncbi:hypothetical protein BH23PAT2_BH23PAT2_01720 [soil metagenome]